MSNLHIEPLTPTIGAEIHDIDLSQTLSDAQVKMIRNALREHLVVFFRDQSLDAGSLDALGRQFGAPHPHYVTPEGVDGFEGVVLVHADADTLANNGGGWHSDCSFDEVPPMGSMWWLSGSGPSSMIGVPSGSASQPGMIPAPMRSSSRTLLPAICDVPTSNTKLGMSPAGTA